MKHAETVTFGGAEFDRAAHLRADTAALTLALQTGQAQTIVLWRGKVLLAAGGTALARVGADHPVLADHQEPLIFLGDDAGTLMFAADISTWEPDFVDADLMAAFLDSTVQAHPAMPDAHGFTELRAVMTSLSPQDAEMAATAKAMHSWHISHRFCACCGQQSIAAMAGWQRDCPACNRPHFPRTDPVVIMLITHGNSVLLGKSPAWPEGMYSLLAGFVEPGETMEAAVRRETKEEAGINVGSVQYLASQPWAYPSSLMFGCRGEALNTDITLDENELEAAMWVSREDLALVLAGEHPVINPPRKGAIAQFLMLNWLADRLD